MTSQRFDRHVPGLMRAGVYTHVNTLHGLRGKWLRRLSGRSSRTEHRLVWFGGLYLASLVSFSGLISAVRWTLELL